MDNIDNIIIEKLKSLNYNNLTFIIKSLYHSINVSNQELYNDLTSMNNNFVLEELSDSYVINIIIKLSQKGENYIVYNPDLQLDIVIQSTITAEFLEMIISRIVVKRSNTSNLLSENQNKQYLFFHYLFRSIKNINIFNKFYPQYDSVKNDHNIKKQTNEIINILRNISSRNYNECFFDVIHLYSISYLLLHSNDLVVYDNFFSDEFKIGLFIPLLLPLVYAIIKIIKIIIKQ